MTTNELCDRLKVTRRQIQWWHEQGLLQCEYDGRHFRDFGDQQALAAAVVAELRRKGVTLPRIRKLKLKAPENEFLVVLGRGSAFRWCTAARLIVCVAEAPGACLVVSLEELRAKLWPAQKTFESRQSAAAMQTR